MTRKPKTSLGIEDLTHPEAKRKNIPTVEHQSVMQHHEQAPVQVAYLPSPPSATERSCVQKKRQTLNSDCDCKSLNEKLTMLLH